MFYTKAKLSDGVTIKTEITDENVFTVCPECGKEFPIDLEGEIRHGGADLYSTQVLCSECSAKQANKR